MLSLPTPPFPKLSLVKTICADLASSQPCWRGLGVDATERNTQIQGTRGHPLSVLDTQGGPWESLSVAWLWA